MLHYANPFLFLTLAQWSAAPVAHEKKQAQQNLSLSFCPSTPIKEGQSGGDSHLISLVFVEAADKYREFPRRGYGSPLLSYES